jgi:hypothetical protein
MTVPGFILTRLTLKGASVPNAEVTFSTGLNVIAGPSDTGKTFIVQCIDYMFGASGAPKEIPEAKSYDLLSLAIRACDGQDEFVLERSLRGGSIRLKQNGMPDRTLAPKHNAGNEDTISFFLLQLCGLNAKKVRTNQQGKTRPLSFRDIARLVVIDEESIISDRSPILTSEFTTATAERGVFRLLLSGIDDSSVVAAEDPKLAKGRQQGRLEVLEGFVKEVQDELSKLDMRGTVDDLRHELARIESLLEAVSKELAAEQQAVSELEEKRRDAWTNLHHVESRSNVLTELQGRFWLLQTQYNSDLRRLQSISEASTRLNQMKAERCPVCGALPEHHDKAHQEKDATPSDVAEASKAEVLKILSLLEDLQNTIQTNAAEISRLDAERREKETVLKSATADIANCVRPRVQAALQRLKEGQVQRDKYRRAIDLHQRLAELELLTRQTEHARPAKLAQPATTAAPASDLELFSQAAEQILRSWKFPGLGRVTYSETDDDLIISGLRRASHGKGVRAITHAAFSLALLKYCRTKNVPHPGLNVIDSPLVVYRQPDTNEGGFSRELKDAFYRTIATDFIDAQVIIMENDEPPADVESKANIIKFTGTDIGRRGFIPSDTAPNAVRRSP